MLDCYYYQNKWYYTQKKPTGKTLFPLAYFFILANLVY